MFSCFLVKNLKFKTLLSQLPAVDGNDNNEEYDNDNNNNNINDASADFSQLCTKYSTLTHPHILTLRQITAFLLKVLSLERKTGFLYFPKTFHSL